MNRRPVGVLALQGDFADHQAALHRHHVATRRVRRAADLEGLGGLVLPGGESTTMLRLLDVEGLYDPLAETLHSGLPVLATCAGLILLARHVTEPRQRSFGVLDLDVQRNGYGRQYHSGTYALDSDTLPAGSRGIFIRAPRITRCGEAVEVLARRASDSVEGSDPVLVRCGAVLGAGFHPELQADHPVTSLFVASLRQTSSTSSFETSSDTSSKIVS